MFQITYSSLQKLFTVMPYVRSAVKEEELIKLVRAHPELYDVDHKLYHNILKRDNVWEAISEKLNHPAPACKKRWTSLRDSYRKVVKARENLNDEAARKKRFWRFETDMEFLLPVISDNQERSTNENLPAFSIETEVKDEYVDSPGSLYSAETERDSVSNNKRKYERDDEDDSRKYQETYRPDHLTKFFQSVEETVRTLAPELQIEVKGEIFRIVNEAEKKNLDMTRIC